MMALVSHPLNGPISSSVSNIYMSQCELHQCVLWDLDARTGRSDPVHESLSLVLRTENSVIHRARGRCPRTCHPQ